MDVLVFAQSFFRTSILLSLQSIFEEYFARVPTCASPFSIQLSFSQALSTVKQSMHRSHPLIPLPPFSCPQTLSMAVSLSPLRPSVLVPMTHLGHLLPRSMRTVPGPYANIQEVGTTPTASYGISPSNPPRNVSMTLSDTVSSQMMTTGTPNMAGSSTGTVQSAMTAMSTNSAVASGSRTSRTANVRKWTVSPEILAY